MDEQTIRKTFKYKIKPTPEQERAMAFVVRRCRELYNPALHERREAWQKCGVSVTLANQSAQLPDIKDARPEYHDIHLQVLQDVLTRMDRAFQAFFRRVKNGETPGYPRFQGSQPLQQLHLQAVRQWGYLGQWLSGSVEDWADCRALESPVGGDTQDGHDLQRDGWLVPLLLLCRRAGTPFA
jgi:hypothetical protein